MHSLDVDAAREQVCLDGPEARKNVNVSENILTRCTVWMPMPRVNRSVPDENKKEGRNNVSVMGECALKRCTDWMPMPRAFRMRTERKEMRVSVKICSHNAPLGCPTPNMNGTEGTFQQGESTHMTGRICNSRCAVEKQSTHYDERKSIQHQDNKTSWNIAKGMSV